jgi:hypothetical protein
MDALDRVHRPRPIAQHGSRACLPDAEDRLEPVAQVAGAED